MGTTDIDGFEELWGNGVHHCPYCHGYEVRGESLGVVSKTSEMVEYAKLIYNLSEDLVVFTDGQDVFDEETRSVFIKQGVEIEEESISALNDSKGLESVSLADGRDVPCDALFYPPPMIQHSELAEQLGLQVNQAGLVETKRSQHGAGFTSVGGLFVAGDASSSSPPSIPSAVADGYEIGGTVNRELSSEVFER